MYANKTLVLVRICVLKPEDIYCNFVTLPLKLQMQRDFGVLLMSNKQLLVPIQATVFVPSAC